MKVESLVEILDADFYVGVPDSQLKPLCNYLMNTYGIGDNHIIAANEGNCTAIAAGYYMATGRFPVVYLQNSGIGNIINPVASLLHNKVYGIPCIFIVGWRGEPNIHDEPQHIFQGEVTLPLLEDMEVSTAIIDKDTSIEELKQKMVKFNEELCCGNSVAFVVRKGALTYDKEVVYENKNMMNREEIISHIVDFSDEDIIVSTTGKASRELFEIRENKKLSHKYDFLTVGSMGHASSIAYGIALQKPAKRIWCIDGDGAALMHMGSMAVIGAKKPKNFIHVIINNASHETVGGMPTVAGEIDFMKIADGCGYSKTMRVENFEELDDALKKLKAERELTLLEIMSSVGSREDLGRPTSTAKNNKEKFMEFLAE